MPEPVWRPRYAEIVDLEQRVAAAGTTIVNGMLHISYEEQRERLLARLDEPAKRWKFNAGDIAERKLWDKYMAVWQEAIRSTSTEHAPWHVVPADSKPFARLVVARTIVDALSRLDLKFPTVGAADLKEMKKMKEALLAEGPVPKSKASSKRTGKAKSAARDRNAGRTAS